MDADADGSKDAHSATLLTDSDIRIPEDFKGNALITFEELAGRGDMDPTDDARTSDDYGGSIRATYQTSDALAAFNLLGEGVTDGLESFNIDDPDGLLACDDCVDVDGTIWMTFTEDGDNHTVFTNAPGDNPSIATATNAPRGLDFAVEYGDESDTSDIGFSTTSIVIDAGAEWNSGEQIGITLTDSDANTNSLDADDLSILDSEQTIPTIRIGSPLTLGEAEDSEAYTVTDVSDILVMKSASTYAEEGTLTIELGSWTDVSAYLPQHEPTFIGTHLLNYDISSLTNATGITLAIQGQTPLTLVNDDDGTSGTIELTGPDFDVTARPGFGILYDDATGNIKDFGGAATSLQISLGENGAVEVGDSIVVDLFSFGLDDPNDDRNTATTVNNAIYRLELEEDGDNSSDFTGTLEYIGLNQLNMWDTATYDGITATGVDVILISDDDSISVEYLDLDSTGGETIFTAGADTPTHSGSVQLDSDGYKIADTVMVTVEDADLNTDSGVRNSYTTYGDAISGEGAVMDLLTIAIDGNPWVAGCSYEDEDENIIEVEGLAATEFTLRETERDSGVFEGTFSVPHLYCATIGTTLVVATVTGTDISAEYIDFRDDSGSVISVSSSAGIRSATGSVSLDRTVYPVPFGADISSTGEAAFPTSGDGVLPQGDLAVYVSINDADFDESSNGIDSIDSDYLTISIIRGSTPHDVPITDVTEIDETEPGSGVFEYEATIKYNDGPADASQCPANTTGCILQGDILHVEYNDPSDASGSSNTVTDSATFDLRNGVLQTDQTAYIIGSDMIVTLIEPDLNLDSGSTETYSLDLIEWDSDAGTCTLTGDDCGSDGKDPFGAVPSNLLETGTDTGIFQVVVGIPDEIDEDKLERGEEITLTYIDWGPSGSDFVGDKDEEISTTAYTSNFGATIELDQRVYTWTDKVYVTVVAPDHNIDSDQVDEIGNNDDYPIRISTRGNEREKYKLVETGADTGIFTGEIILTGFQPHDADGDKDFTDAPALTQGDGTY